jgi:hypothetical protein
MTRPSGLSWPQPGAEGRAARLKLRPAFRRWERPATCSIWPRISGRWRSPPDLTQSYRCRCTFIKLVLFLPVPAWRLVRARRDPSGARRLAAACSASGRRRHSSVVEHRGDPGDGGSIPFGDTSHSLRVRKRIVNPWESLTGLGSTPNKTASGNRPLPSLPRSGGFGQRTGRGRRGGAMRRGGYRRACEVRARAPA